MSASTQHLIALRCHRRRQNLIGLKDCRDGWNFIFGFRPQLTIPMDGRREAPPLPP
jgi:hypothetical protein